MSDLEGLANRLLDSHLDESMIINSIVNQLSLYKANITEDKAITLARAILSEVKRSRRSIQSKELRRLLGYSKANVTMGDAGVGSRGTGDAFVHQLISTIASLGDKSSIVTASSLDDAGVVYNSRRLIVVAVDGIHSRLSDFPFIAGFHTARAAIRDVVVKGAKPIALLDDIHLADDGDVGKLFDFVAGVNAVSELTGIPLVTGSTLRVGGDMVVGDRMVGCVGAVGIITERSRLKSRADISIGDSILMTEGSGGGTIATTALYSGAADIVTETLNLEFYTTCRALTESRLSKYVHYMTDVTNGGIRGDASSICSSQKVRLVLEEDRILELINPSVLRLLKAQDVDPLGVSLDAILIFSEARKAGALAELLSQHGIRSEKIGNVSRGKGAVLLTNDGRTCDLKPKFRESAYTEIKKVVGENQPRNFVQARKRLTRAFKKSVAKRQFLVKTIRERPRSI